jgi:hypothetical protein
MKRTTSFAGMGAAALLAVGLGLAGAGAADASTQYVAGSAVPNKLGYDVNAWSKTWSCSYTGWAYPSKDWSCELLTSDETGLLASHSGTFTGSSKSTPLYYFASSNDYFCARAWAMYQDGSSSSKNVRCG